MHKFFIHILLLVVIAVGLVAAEPKEAGVYVATNDGKYYPLWSINDGSGEVALPFAGGRNDIYKHKLVRYWRDYTAKDDSLSNVFKVKVKADNFKGLLFVNVPNMRHLTIHKVITCLKPPKGFASNFPGIGFLHDNNTEYSQKYGIKFDQCYSLENGHHIAVLDDWKRYNFSKRQVSRHSYLVRSGLFSKNGRYSVWIGNDIWWFEIY